MPIPNTKGKFCTNVQDMEIGDYIACKYVASNRTAGEFSDLGAALNVAQANEIPIDSSATPNGYFYFIKADTGILIADRNVQHSVTWSMLNTKGYVEGFIKEERIMPVSSTATTYQNNYPPSKLYDNITDSKNVNGWWSQQGVPILNQVIDFIISYTGTINSIKIINGYYTAGVKNFKLQYSVDGKTFIDENIYLIPQDGEITIQTKIKNAQIVRLLLIDGYYGGQNYATLSEVYINGSSFPLIRSLDGGISYIDANGNSSLVYTTPGAFPANNEWDKYIEKSNLNGKIIAGDDKVWNRKNGMSWCKNCTRIGTFINSTGSSESAVANRRTIRGLAVLTGGWTDWSHATVENISNLVNFRPVLQLLHPKQTNFYY